MAETHKSAFAVVVPPAKPIEKADRIEFREIPGYGPVVSQKGIFEPGEVAIFIEPDSLVPLDKPEFSWLRDTGRRPKLVDGREYHLVRAVRLRKQLSVGLLLKASELRWPSAQGLTAGDDLTAALEVLHYDPPAAAEKQEQEPKAKRWSVRWWIQRALSATFGRYDVVPRGLSLPYYDIPHLRHNLGVIGPHDEVEVTEKIHGSNMAVTWIPRGRFSYSTSDGLRIGSTRFGRGGIQQLTDIDLALRVRSRTVWRRPGDDFDTAARTAGVVAFVRDHPGLVVFGEMFGPSVQKGFHYGVPAGQVGFMAFDIYDPEHRQWMTPSSFHLACRQYQIPEVPWLGIGELGSFNLQGPGSMSEGKTVVIDGPSAHVREGVVIKQVGKGGYDLGCTVRNLYDWRDRVPAFKVVGSDYLLTDV